MLVRPFVKNPLGLLLLVFVTSLRSILFICSFFGTVYGLITFLIYVTGILVLFSYILSIFPNFMLGIHGRNLIWIRFPCFFFLDFTFDSPFAEESNVATMVLGFNYLLFILLVIVLLFSLVVVSVLSYKGGRPLRSR